MIKDSVRSKNLNIAVKLAYNVGIFFLMMIPGIIMKKTKLSTDGLGKGLSNLVLYVAQPVLIFVSYLREFDKSVFINMLWVFIFSIAVHAIFSLISMASFKKSPDGVRRMLRFATIFSNAVSNTPRSLTNAWEYPTFAISISTIRCPVLL